MNRTCNGCYAAITAGCQLRFKNKDGKPQEECPKPKSWRQLENIRKWGWEHGTTDTSEK